MKRWKYISTAFLAAALGLSLFGCATDRDYYGRKPVTRAPTIVNYSCPVHPEVVQATPGYCSKCGAALRANYADSPGVSVRTSPVATYYSCPNHPEINQATAGFCSKCGMPLRLYEVR
ncbi:MAG: hypothetical protein DME26_10950 [Verrucomicrobia bacterium]|nr:MAG: hypothetical protein DME26_10950 [Verrucomicrobiota bacterium]